MVDPGKGLLPPCHIKLGLLKQFVKALPKEGDCFKYLCNQFPGLSEAKLKEGIFVGLDIRKIVKDKIFEVKIEANEKQACKAFKLAVTSFLGTKKNPDYKCIIEDILEKFKVVVCKMSLKVHFLHSYLDYFPKHLGAVSEEQGGSCLLYTSRCV